MLEDRHLGNSHVGNVARGDGASVYHLELPRLFQRGEREIVLAYKIFVYKRDASSSGVKKCIGLNFPILKGKRAGDHKMPAFHPIDFDIRYRETRIMNRQRGERALARANKRAKAYPFPENEEADEEAAEESGVMGAWEGETTGTDGT